MPTQILALCLLTALFAASCKKDQRVLDTSVQPETDQYNSVNSETLAITAFSERHDSIYSYNGGEKFLGTNNDPVFGKAEAGLYLNANFSRVGISFGPNPQLVSAEFIFVINDPRYAGNRDAALTYSIYPLDSALNRQRVYMTSDNRLHSPVPLTTMPVVARSVLNGSLVVLRIPLDSDYAGAMIRDEAAFADVGTFQSKYKGFYIVGAPADGGEGVISVCDLDASQSRLVIRFTPDTAANVDSINFVFTGDRAVRFNTIEHEYANADPQLKAQLSASTAATGNLYVQGLAGTRIHVDLPIEKELSDSFNIAVSRAELVLKIDPATIKTGYQPPPYLALLPVAVTGKDTLSYDQFNLTDFARYGGTYDKNSQQYVFNIARHVQAIFNGDKANLGFRVVVANPDRALTFFRDDYFERVVLGGRSHPSLYPTFRISYSKIRVN